MKASYLTLAGPGRAEITIQRSRFIGQAWPCVSEAEALLHIREAKEKTRDASHHCWAYVVGQNEGIIRYSDDGEPGGTAGLPIVSLIRAERLVDCCVVVTRYFGGVLLGTGGLVRAYTQGCRIALDAAHIVRMELTCLDLCEIPYSVWDKVRYVLEQLPAKIDKVEYGSAISFILKTRQKDHEQILAQLEQASSRQLLCMKDEEKYDAWDV